MLKQLKQLLAFVMLHIRNANKEALTWSEPEYGRVSMIVETESLFSSELNLSHIGSKEQFVNELRAMMPISSDIDYKALNCCIHYYNLKDKETTGNKFLERKPEYQFGKWLVETLYEKKKATDSGKLDLIVSRLMEDYLK